ncbi:MAG: CHAT domain-containing protein [Nostocaceae cyanobacterium]|nr:CHAT domain-containing protein [Nostocaceae cyanobacterium]
MRVTRYHLLLAVVTALLCFIISPGLANIPELAVQQCCSPTVQSQDKLQQGKTLYDAGRFSEAVQLLQQALQEYRTSGDRLRQAVTLSNLSLTYQQLGDWTQAKQTITESLQLQGYKGTDLIQNPTSKIPNGQVLAQTLDILGRLQLTTGQSQAALATWSEATNRYIAAGDKTGEINSRINQAQALQALGFYRRAIFILKDLQATLQSQPDSAIKAVGLRSLGDALQLTGNLDEARKVLEESLKIAQGLPSPQVKSATLFSLGNTARAQKQVEAAVKFYQQAAELSTSGILQAKAQLNLLGLLIETKQRSPAQELLPKITQQIESLPASRDAIYARIKLAQTIVASGEQTTPHPQSKIAQILAIAVKQAQELGDKRAESYATGSLAGLYEQNQQWKEAQKLTQQALILALGIDAADIAYRWEWQMGRLLKAQGDIPGASSAYDNAIASLDSLRSDLVAVNQDVQFNFRDSVEPVYRQSVELLLQGQVTPENLNKARQRMEALQLAELDNFFREACLNFQSVVLDQVVDQDNPTTAIFYPIILDNELDVILKLPQQPLRHHTVKLPRPEVEEVLTRLREVIVEPDAFKQTRSLSQQVYDWLIKPVESELETSGANTLVFVLDGALRNIPMAALYDGEQYLVEKYAVALSPGLQLLSPQPLAKVKLNALTAGLTQPPPDEKNFAPLPEVKTEIELIQQAGVSTTTLLDGKFTSKALKQEMNAAPFNIVHLATHGNFSSQARDTFILAADGRINVSELDNLLRRREELRSPTLVELLVLSACQTAAGDNRAVLGLAGIAVRAGARSTLASLWHIDDKSTAIFIGQFYQELAQDKVTKAEALRRAQVKLLKDYPDYNRPGYWAPYVLVGNWL